MLLRSVMRYGLGVAPSHALVVAGALLFATAPALSAQESFTVDSSLAKRGKSLWANRGCIGCHSIGGGKRSGPDLAGVLERRDHGWLRRWLKNPTPMFETDSLAQALLAQYNNTKMPNPRLTEQEIEALLNFIAQESARVKIGSGS
ncbi:MAG TPA: cytochrome c [Gemmatimonadales bacterium]|jgi:cbb3-type cytochrome oxidase cytochrome c subunit